MSSGDESTTAAETLSHYMQGNAYFSMTETQLTAELRELKGGVLDNH